MQKRGYFREWWCMQKAVKEKVALAGEFMAVVNG